MIVVRAGRRVAVRIRTPVVAMRGVEYVMPWRMPRSLAGRRAVRRCVRTTVVGGPWVRTSCALVRPARPARP